MNLVAYYKYTIWSATQTWTDHLAEYNRIGVIINYGAHFSRIAPLAHAFTLCYNPRIVGRLHAAQRFSSKSFRH